MKRLSLYNRRGMAWLLSLAFVLMSTVSRSSWQCLDGHPCPPGCTMQHLGEKAKATKAASLPTCCQRQKSPNSDAGHCNLCTNARSEHAQMQERCTSPVCVLRMQAKPDISSQAPVHFVFDTPVTLLPILPPTLISEETGSLAFGSPRAPPERAVVRLHASRAPPILL